MELRLADPWSFRKRERLDRLVAQRKTGQSPGSIQGLKTRGNITTASSWKETLNEEGLKAVNMNPGNPCIQGGDEGDG